MNTNRTILLAIVVIAIAALRLYIDIPNFSPIGAIALLGAAMFKPRAVALGVSFGALLLSDLLLSLKSDLYSSYLLSGSMWSVYLAFGLIVWLGFALQKRLSFLNTLGFGVLASILFFVITNASVWLFSDLYPVGISGLLASLAAGVPFFKNTLASQLLFSVILYISYQMIAKKSALTLVNK